MEFRELWLILFRAVIDQVHEKIIAISERYGTNNIGIVTTCYSYEYRALSYKLVSEAFGLDKIKSQ